MRPPRSSSLICPGSAAPRQGAVTLAVGAASRGSGASREDHAGAASNSTQVVPSDLPAWAAATSAPSRRAGSPERDAVDVSDLEDECAHKGVVAGARRTLNKQRGAGAGVSRLDPSYDRRNGRNPQCLATNRQTSRLFTRDWCGSDWSVGATQAEGDRDVGRQRRDTEMIGQFCISLLLL
jgi:hypothetical protein